MARKDILNIYDDVVFRLIRTKLAPYFNDTSSGGLPLDTTDISTHFEFATPERPFGFQDNENPEQDTDRAALTLPSPRIAVTRMDMRLSMLRNNTSWLRLVDWWDPQCKYAIGGRFPSPWDINYQVDIYARYREDANKLLHWFLYYPKPVHALRVNFGAPWGNKSISLIFSQILDTSVLESGENERWIRHTVPMVLETYLFEAFDHLGDIPTGALEPGAITQRNRTAHEFTVQICDWEGTVLYDEFQAP